MKKILKKGIPFIILALLLASTVYAANSHSADLESGSSQFFHAADSASTSQTGDMTLEAWIKPESQPGTDARLVITSKWSGSCDAGTGKTFIFAYRDTTGTECCWQYHEWRRLWSTYRRI